MVAVTKNVPCPWCGKEISNYKIQSDPPRLVFICQCKRVTCLTEDEYRTLLAGGSVLVNSEIMQVK